METYLYMRTECVNLDLEVNLELGKDGRALVSASARIEVHNGPSGQVEPGVTSDEGASVSFNRRGEHRREERESSRGSDGEDSESTHCSC